MAGKKKASAIR